MTTQLENMAASSVSLAVSRSFGNFIKHGNAVLLAKTCQMWNHMMNLSPSLSATYCTIVSHKIDATVEFRQGLSVFSVPLPSRKESCELVLKPISHTVKDFVSFLKEEDKGIDRVAFYRENGSKIAGSTSVDFLLRSPFQVQINEISYFITPPETVSNVPSESFEKIVEVKNVMAKLYSELNVEEHQVKSEQEIIRKLEGYRLQIIPYLKKKKEIEQGLLSRNTRLMCIGSFCMGVQFGIFTRLTWWEYSWDVMEPVTYFATYGAVICMYAYFVVSAQEYNYADVWDKEFVNRFHKVAKKHGFNITEYNQLVMSIAQCESDLRRLRDPLQVHLPIREL